LKQLEEKNKSLENMKQLIDSLNKQRDSNEDTIKSLKAANNKLENKLQLSIKEINKGNDIIQNLIQNIIIWYSQKKEHINIEELNFYNKNISLLNHIKLNLYFSEIIRKEIIKIGKYFSYIIKTKLNNNKKEELIEPYLPKEIERNKKFTLVLDLDETLISFRFNKTYKGILKKRPGLLKFLNDVGTKYELVIFTAGTHEYADPLLDIIEKNKKIFAKRLYRQHTVFVDNIFVKDLTKLGRDLSKIIIIDNMPQNFILQKENGIFIKNYFGQEDDDMALLDLIPILLKIASNPNNDVRKELKKYKEEIFTRITTNLN
jgi:CTD small phosphatase-like protein 2